MRPSKQKIDNNSDFEKCSDCKSVLLITKNFYKVDTKIYPSGFLPICRSCIKKQVATEGLVAVERILRQMDKPLIVSEWNSCVKSGKEPFGWYMRQVNSLSQYKGMTFADSVGNIKESTTLSPSYTTGEEEDIYGRPTVEVQRKWGTGYSNREYYELEKTWEDMRRVNAIETPQHIDALSLYCKLKVKVDRALENDDMSTFKVLNKEFQDVSKNSGFRPIDKLSGSEASGIRNFSTIFEEVEKDGFIEPYPLEFNQDIVDKTIMYLSNYTRKVLMMEQLIYPPDDTPQVYEGDDE